MNKVEEGRALLNASYHIPFDGIFNVNPLIEKMEKGAALESGNRVASNASKELKKIRKQIDVCEGQIKEKLEKFLKDPTNICEFQGKKA